MSNFLAMNLKLLKILCVLYFLHFNLYAQDTLTIIHYNLLNYGLSAYGCNNTNNNPDDKDSYLRIIQKKHYIYIS